MTRRSRTLLSGAASAAAVALVTGCGGSSTTTVVVREMTGPAPATRASNATPRRPGDERIARSALLDRNRLPAGWATIDGDDAAPPNFCPRVRAAGADLTARAATQFGHDQSRIRSVVYVYPGARIAGERIASLLDAEDRRCEARRFARNVRDDPDAPTVGTPTSLEVTGDPLGVDSRTTRVELPVDRGDGHEVAEVTITITRVGRMLAILETSSVDADLRRTLAAEAARGVERAVDHEAGR